MKYEGYEVIVTWHTETQLFSAYANLSDGQIGYAESARLDELEEAIKSEIDEHIALYGR